MKQTFTFFALLFLATNDSNAQTNFSETFEGKTASDLTTSGWTLTGALDVNTTSEITGTNSLRFDATNAFTAANFKTASITLMDEFINVSFKYRSGSLSGNGTIRTINYGFNNGTFNSLGSITLSPGNLTTIQTVSTNTTVTPGSSLKLEFQLSANNNQNEDLYIDDIRIIPSVAMSPLPIKLVSLTGAAIGNKAQLSWSVADNETGDRFEIEKSADGMNYATEAIVFTTQKKGAEDYHYNGTKEMTSNTSFRLKIINKNNTTHYSRIIFLKKETGSVQGITLLQNPIGSSLSFIYDAAASGVAMVNIYNTAGVKVHSFHIKMQKGSNTIIQSLDNKLTTGNYVLEVATATERRTIKISK